MKIMSDDPDMLEEYDFSKGVIGKYAKRYAGGTNVVVIDPDLAEFVSYSNSMVKLKNLNFKKNKYHNINNLFFKQINLPGNLNRIPEFFPDHDSVNEALRSLANVIKKREKRFAQHSAVNTFGEVA